MVARRTQLTRQVVYLRPDFVIVHDLVGTVKDYFAKELRWNFLNAPVVSGNSFVESVGSSKLFAATFSSQQLTTTSTPVSENNNTIYQISTQNTNPIKDVRYTTAFQSAPSTTSAMIGTTSVTSSDGRMEGVRMGNQLVLFGTDGLVDLSSGSLSYNVAGTEALTNLLVDLSPGAAYQIIVDGNFVGTKTASDQGTISFSTPAGATNVSVVLASSSLTANPDSYPISRNGVLTVGATSGVLANDFNPNGGPMSAVFASGPSHGTLSLNNDGSFIYTPSTNFTGTDTFTYRASDGAANSSPATVTITVQDTAPVAVNDSYTVVWNRATTIAKPNGVLANDSDADGDPLTSALVNGPSHGTLSFNNDGSFTYTPTTNFIGTDSFTYRDSDGVANSLPATVTITVYDTAPVAINDSYTVVWNRPTTVTKPNGLLANDSDADGDPLTSALVNGPSHGTLSLNNDGSFTYTPTTNFTGTDTFTYRDFDGAANSSPATVTLTVQDIAPFAVNDSYTIVWNRPTTIAKPNGVLANDSDADGDPLTSALVNGPSHGTLSFNNDGSFTYTPTTNFIGTDSFTYRDSDGVANSLPATVTITVYDTAPVAINDSYTVVWNRPTTVTKPNGLFANDSDADGDPLTSALVNGPSHGTLSLNNDGSFTYTPTTNFTGTDTFTYRDFDGAANSSPAIVTIITNQDGTFALALDFNTATSPTAPGYVGVGPVQYSTSNHLGWQSLSGIGAISRSSSSPLTRDFHYGVDGTFLADVPNGIYDIVVGLGDASSVRDRVSVWAEGQLLAANVTTQANQFVEVRGRVNVSDGQLTLRLADGGGANPRFAIDKLVLTTVNQNATHFWSGSQLPEVANSSSSSKVEPGIRFQSDVAGYITGIRFYKGSHNTGIHTGSLWSATGTKLATATFTNETASGWQQVWFGSPIPIQANTTYVASYLAPKGRFSVNLDYFSVSGLSSGHLSIASSAQGGGGTFASGGGFPTQMSHNSNYWVDVTFGLTNTPPSIAKVTPADQTSNVSTSTNIKLTFDENLDPTSLTSNDVFLRTAAGTIVSATLSYDATTFTVTLTPTSGLWPPERRSLS